MRIFIGIDLNDDIRGKIARFLDGVSGFAPEARWVRPESLHVTLKFIGEQKPEQVTAITDRLRSIESTPIEIRLAGFGFFPTEKAPRVFWVGIHSDPRLARLAADIDASVAELGIPREERAFSPHLTLARGGSHGRRSSGDPKWRMGDGPNSVFAVLQKRLSAMAELDSAHLEFGTMTADKFFLYQSQLSPAGSKYTKLESYQMKQ
jgi:2'-5' RNA ligase